MYALANHDAHLLAPLLAFEATQESYERRFDRACDELAADPKAMIEVLAEALGDLGIEEEAGDMLARLNIAPTTLLYWERVNPCGGYDWRHRAHFPMGLLDHAYALFEREADRRAEAAR